MVQIIEKIIEPSQIEVGSSFKIKVRILDVLSSKKKIITEDSIKLITENGRKIRTEWGE